MSALIDVINPILDVAPLAPKLVVTFVAFPRSSFKLKVSDLS